MSEKVWKLIQRLIKASVINTHLLFHVNGEQVWELNESLLDSFCISDRIFLCSVDWNTEQLQNSSDRHSCVDRRILHSFKTVTQQARNQIFRIGALSLQSRLLSSLSLKFSLAKLNSQSEANRYQTMVPTDSVSKLSHHTSPQRWSQSSAGTQSLCVINRAKLKCFLLHKLMLKHTIWKERGREMIGWDYLPVCSRRILVPQTVTSAVEPH